MESAIWIVQVIHIGRYGPLGETPFHSRLSLCNKDLVEYAYFWIIWKVLKTSLEQMDSIYVGNEFSCVVSISGECFVLAKVIKLSAVLIQM